MCKYHANIKIETQVFIENVCLPQLMQRDNFPLLSLSNCMTDSDFGEGAHCT